MQLNARSQYRRALLNIKISHSKKTLTSLFFLIFLFAGISSFGQRISLKGHNVSLEKIMNDIKNQTGYSFFYNRDWLQKAKPVNIDVENMILEEALNLCFDGQPFSYAIVNKTIVLKLKEKNASSRSQNTTSDNNQQQVISVTGIVQDKDGTPLNGASVTLKRTKSVSICNQKGMFQLDNVFLGDTLSVSYVGYTSKEIVVSDNSTLIYIALENSDNELDKTIVEAYGTTSRRFNVGSISTVDAETIEKQPVLNPLLALEGQVPGLAINATNGVPGSQVLVQVRGQNSISTSGSPTSFKPYDQPLFIIDGVPFASDGINGNNGSINQLNSLANAQSFNGGISQAGGISPFANINPNDIESISILKDADATSIYGTQGANGVILITTKKGHAGKTNFNLSINTAANTSIRPVDLLNTAQYLQLRKDAFAIDSITPSNDPNDQTYDPAYAPDLTIFDQNKYTNWQNVIYGKTSHNTDVHASVSGGDNNTTFLISAGYTNSDYNYPGNYYDRRWTFHSSLHHASKDNKFSIDFINDYGYNKNNSPGGGGNTLLPPNLPDLLDAKGDLVWSYKGVDLSQYQFYSYLKQQANLNNYNLNSSLQIGYEILKGLHLNVSLGYNRNTTSEYSDDPLAAQTPLNGTSEADFANSVNETINIEPQLTYNVAIGKGTLNALIGATYKKMTSTSTTTDGTGYSNDNLLGSINGASTVTSSDNSDLNKYNAGFGRLQYVYAQKYILSLTGRRDGSSNFGPGRQFGNFGSVGGGWIFSEEKGFKESLPFMSYAKLSADYGTSGSDGTSYQYQAYWEPNGNLPAFQGVRPSFPQNLYNPDFSWSLKKSLNLAMDLGLFDNRILLNATFYRDREGNQLASYPLPIQTGFMSVFENLVATVQNQGWEFSLNSINIQSKNFTWKSNFNITFNRNKLVSYPNIDASTYSNLYVVGKPTSIVLGFKYKDVNPQTGLFEFYTSNGGVTSNPNEALASQGGDVVPIGDREVNYMGGFGNTFSYKRFSLYMFFQFSSQTAPTYLQTVYQFHALGTTATNEPLAILGNYWTKPGDHAELQRPTALSDLDASTASADFAESSGVYTKDTYLRLKTISLSYSLPDSFVKKLHIQDCSIYINAQNVLTFTNYKVGDPEKFSDYTSLPLQRTIACGLNFNF